MFIPLKFYSRKT